MKNSIPSSAYKIDKANNDEKQTVDLFGIQLPKHLYILFIAIVGLVWGLSAVNIAWVSFSIHPQTSPQTQEENNEPSTPEQQGGEEDDKPADQLPPNAGENPYSISTPEQVEQVSSSDDSEADDQTEADGQQGEHLQDDTGNPPSGPEAQANVETVIIEAKNVKALCIDKEGIQKQRDIKYPNFEEIEFISNESSQIIARNKQQNTPVLFYVSSSFVDVEGHVTMGKNINVRTSPSQTEDNVFFSLPFGIPVEVIETEGEWFRIQIPSEHIYFQNIE